MEARVKKWGKSPLPAVATLQVGNPLPEQSQVGRRYQACPADAFGLGA
jgi:hypothetical protein